MPTFFGKILNHDTYRGGHFSTLFYCNKLSEQVKTELENHLKIDFQKSSYKSRLIGNQNKT
jgi:hypothetical protein